MNRVDLETSVAADRGAVVEGRAESENHHDSAPAAPETGVAAAARWRWCYRIAVVVAVSPIVVSALRRGLTGWEPSWDVATTVVRIRDVFSMHPPLTGMAAQPSASAEVAYSFPGPMHLYLLAIPVRLLGTTWGVLLGMAAINIGCCVAALWLVRRRVGERWAVVAATVLAALLWTVGSGVLVYPTPLAIGIVPLFAFFVAAWSVAEGDRPAYVILAVLANYLFLNQLVFVVVVPVVVTVAVGLDLARRHRARRADPTGRTRRRRHDRRWLGAAALVTLVAWLPPLIDQFFTPGGNLGKLIGAFASGQVAAEQPAAVSPSLTGALGLVASVTAVPPAWLPPSFDRAPFGPEGANASFLTGLLWSVALFGLLAWATWRAVRRSDHRVVTAVAIAVAGWGAYLLTALGNPDPKGFAQRYFLGLWSSAAFLWFVTIVAVVRALPRRVRRVRLAVPVGLAAVGVVLVVVAALAGFRESTNFALMPSRSTEVAPDIRAAMVPELVGEGPILIDGRHFRMRRHLPSMMLGLQDAGTEFRVQTAFDAQQFGASRWARQHPDAVTRLRLSPSEEHGADERLVATFEPEPYLTPEEFGRLQDVLIDWLSTDVDDRINPALELDPADRAEAEASLDDALAAADGDVAGVLEASVDMLAGWGQVDGVALFDVPGLTGDELQVWALEAQRRSLGIVHLFAAPLER